jgi:hypothetical protein
MTGRPVGTPSSCPSLAVANFPGAHAPTMGVAAGTTTLTITARQFTLGDGTGASDVMLRERFPAARLAWWRRRGATRRLRGLTAFESHVRRHRLAWSMGLTTVTILDQLLWWGWRLADWDWLLTSGAVLFASGRRRRDR